MADVLVEASGAAIAFMPSEFLEDAVLTGDLEAALQYPTDELAVVKLTGEQIEKALERAISLHPSPNPAFLYLSGMTVTFDESAPVGSRVTAVTISDAALSDTAVYRVAMPNRMARGGLGYFTVWEKTAIEQVMEGVTLESLMQGKTSEPAEKRWREVGGA
jgi:2',3'-cyclic-nucleotide 2'-phosphodiesterase (5'-nucleotidase family)